METIDLGLLLCFGSLSPTGDTHLWLWAQPRQLSGHKRRRSRWSLRKAGCCAMGPRLAAVELISACLLGHQLHVLAVDTSVPVFQLGKPSFFVLFFGGGKKRKHFFTETDERHSTWQRDSGQALNNPGAVCKHQHSGEKEWAGLTGHFTLQRGARQHFHTGLPLFPHLTFVQRPCHNLNRCEVLGCLRSFWHKEEVGAQSPCWSPAHAGTASP